MTDKTKDSAKQKSSSRKMMKILLTLSILFFFFLFGTVITVLIFPAPIVRFVFSQVESRTGIAVTFEKAYFSLGLTLDGLTVKRQNHPVCNFDLKADKVHLLPISRHHKPQFSVAGLRGIYEKAGKNVPDKKNNANDTKTKKSFWKRGRTLISFTDSEVLFIDRTLEKPFQITIQIDTLDISDSYTGAETIFGTYYISGTGLLNTDSFFHIGASESHFLFVPFELLSPYVPVLDDIFSTGKVEIKTHDLTSEMQKGISVKVFLLKDCRIKSADEILTPAIRTVFKKMDQSPVPVLPELKEKIGNLQVFSESLRSELDKAAPVVEALKMLAPPDVRKKYEKYKSQYDRLRNAPEEWNAKLETLLREIDKAKADIVSDTFRHFVESQTPIEFYVYEDKENGEWKCDWDEGIVRLLEQNFQTLITNEYEKRIREMLNSVNQLMIP